MTGELPPDRLPQRVMDDPVTAPDQHEPGNRGLAYVGALSCAVLLPLLLLGDHPNVAEVAWVAGCSAALLAAVAVDRQLRRWGLRA